MEASAKHEAQDMNPLEFCAGDQVDASPVGPGVVTSIGHHGPEVNHTTVEWFERTDGARFDPLFRRGGTRPAFSVAPAPVAPVAKR